MAQSIRLLIFIFLTASDSTYFTLTGDFVGVSVRFKGEDPAPFAFFLFDFESLAFLLPGSDALGLEDLQPII